MVQNGMRKSRESKFVPKGKYASHKVHNMMLCILTNQSQLVVSLQTRHASSPRHWARDLMHCHRDPPKSATHPDLMRTMTTRPQANLLRILAWSVQPDKWIVIGTHWGLEVEIDQILAAIGDRDARLVVTRGNFEHAIRELATSERNVTPFTCTYLC